MPELPEVETVCRGLNQVTLDQELLGGEVLLPRTVAYPTTIAEFLDSLQGMAIAQWHRRGKYLLAALRSAHDSGTSPAAGWLGVHLRMTGQLLWLPQQTPLPTHCRVRFFLGQQQELRFVDQRTFGRIWRVPAGVAVERIITGLANLGPEPLSDEFSVGYLAEQLGDRRRPIKTALLDQAIIAGIGNIYADEALFESGIHPKTLCYQLGRSQLETLHHAIQHVLSQGIIAGGTTIQTFKTVEGTNGNYGGMAWVYNRENEPCRTCGSPIHRIKLAGRSAHFCPQCQPF